MSPIFCNVLLFSPFLARGDPVQNRPQNPAPAGCLSLLERVELRSQKEGILGKEIAWGRVGWAGQKKEKRMRKKKVLLFLGSGRNTVSRVLFRKRELTEFSGKLGEFCEKLGEFALAHK